MCGFIGFTNKFDVAAASEIAEKMMDSITHRGPDEADKYIDENIAMGFRRLSIIGLEGGNQPIFNEDKTLVLTFNGEIYNYREIKKDLLKKGHIFSTETDSEVLVHGFEEYGVDLAGKLRGMFSFVIYNKISNELYGARDMFGIKPFFYTFQNNQLLYSSELKAFLHYPEFKKELNEEALEQYLSFQYSVMDETFFKGVYKLKPAHYFTYKQGEFNSVRYFTPDFNEVDGSFEEYSEKIDECIKESVEAHKISDVEVGSFLSSGIDSSYIVATARVDKTFTVGFADNGYSEIEYAKKFSEGVGIKNISKVITKEEFFNEFPKIQYHMDEPLADPAAVALYFVCNLASQYVKVVLSGEGADELFGGYRIYSEPLSAGAYGKLPFVIRRIIGKIASILPKKYGVNFLIRKGQRLDERYIGNANMFSKKEREKLLKNPKKLPSAPELLKPLYNQFKGKDDITTMQLIDINTWLIGDILQKCDRMSMANSLEARVPFLDKKVMELASQIPVRHRVTPTNTKICLRHAAKDCLPEFTAQKEKLGFPVPIRVWLKQDEYFNTVKEEFLSEAAKKYFNTDLLIKLLDEHKAGKKDNSRKIWTVYSFLVWYNHYFN